ncbi:class F sortase [Streptomyces sp. NPDC059009]|uniref:class F sortase n=1 Tax=Streptomyces sp. NPDC059009 TaxID=3346694 RepID=UPI0036BDF5BA
MFRSRSPQPIWRTHVLPAVACLALASAVTGCSDGTDEVRTITASDAPVVSDAPSPDRQASDRSTSPTRVSIPSVGVSSGLMRLGLNDDGTVEVPPAEKGMTAGWYTGNPAPGEPGASVIIGHNDTRFGKAVFHDLKKIRKGADITVRNSRGKALRFTVTGTETVSKKTFPTDKVYGATNSRALRLITCDGAFDDAGHPVDNLIVYAELS